MQHPVPDNVTAAGIRRAVGAGGDSRPVVAPRRADAAESAQEEEDSPFSAELDGAAVMEHRKHNGHAKFGEPWTHASLSRGLLRRAHKHAVDAKHAHSLPKSSDRVPGASFCAGRAPFWARLTRHTTQDTAPPRCTAPPAPSRRRWPRTRAARTSARTTPRRNSSRRARRTRTPALRRRRWRG